MSALNTQIGGSHYSKKAIQPVEYIYANNLDFLEGCIVKRITRWRDKDGFKDLEKIKHEVDLLIEQEKKKRAEADQQKADDQRKAIMGAAGIGRSVLGDWYDPFAPGGRFGGAV